MQLLANTENLLQARGDQLVRELELDDFNRGYARAANRIASFPDIRASCDAAAGKMPSDAELNPQNPRHFRDFSEKRPWHSRRGAARW